MAVSILECLLGAELNFKSARVEHNPIARIACEQLHNAVGLLDKGYGIWDEVDPLIEKHGKVEDVPKKEAPMTQSTGGGSGN